MPKATLFQILLIAVLPVQASIEFGFNFTVVKWLNAVCLYQLISYSLNGFTMSLQT